MSTTLAGLHAGDTLVVGQCAGEPTFLTAEVARSRDRITGATVYRGMSLSHTLTSRHADHLRFLSTGALGTNSELFKDGVLDLLPVPVSQIPVLWRTGRMPVDAVLVQASPAQPDGTCSLGVNADYLPAAIETGAIVIAQINDQMPVTKGDTRIRPERFAASVVYSQELVEFPDALPSARDREVATHVAGLVHDGATIQVGVGGLGTAICESLTNHRDLGIHTGLLTDSLVGLVRRGVVTNSRKPIDQGLVVTPVVMGSRETYVWADHNAELSVRRVEYTNGIRTLAQIAGFTAINFALEVDLYGQVNSEYAGDRYIGAIGGLPDFGRGAVEAEGGRSIIAMRAASSDGTRSRVVPRLGGPVVTAPRSDVDFVVTEHGVADLRAASVADRARRLIAIAAPQFRSELEYLARSM
ncbi:hypothetical protein ASE01_17120 [Nocardioides sp. Root190]|uniref:acetyl-CoA hydrolase/transferase family protein n=1 Tax=Nocardioides sp. Root190 TaxID=1736488 RepID=UPI0006FEF065|nr:acetyl-CoA hydrolase/transferase C-terminal domain-containing protein [Nocardioides sp. Root190]KRB75083.1 hypothetical protein ASE01_17120 [Nocardioides sp. Root190]